MAPRHHLEPSQRTPNPTVPTDSQPLEAADRRPKHRSDGPTTVATGDPHRQVHTPSSGPRAATPLAADDSPPLPKLAPLHGPRSNVRNTQPDDPTTIQHRRCSQAELRSDPRLDVQTSLVLAHLQRPCYARTVRQPHVLTSETLRLSALCLHSSQHLLIHRLA